MPRKKKKNLDTLIEDIYSVVGELGEGKAIDVSEEDLDKFGEFMRQALKDWLTPRANKKPTLRMSNIGRPQRQLQHLLELFIFIQINRNY